MKSFILKLALLVIVLSPLLPTKSSEANKKTLRYNNAQIQELVITLNHLRSPID